MTSEDHVGILPLVQPLEEEKAVNGKEVNMRAKDGQELAVN